MVLYTYQYYFIVEMVQINWMPRAIFLSSDSATVKTAWLRPSC